MKIRRALISVWDKTGIVEFARALQEEFAIEIVSTGGTAKALRDAGIPVTLIEDITGFPELLDGRVKTLHPSIHAAILADRDNPEHMRQLESHGIQPIDMVVVNLYPFEQTVADPNCTFAQAIEMIDIGGVALLRAAGKNSRHVVAIYNPRDYDVIIGLMRQSEMRSEWSCRGSARDALAHTAWYDAQIATWLSRMPQYDATSYRFIRTFDFGPLRYGENPHQQASEAAIWGTREASLSLITGERVGDSATELSFNNFQDADAALGLCAELSRAAGAMWHRPSANERCGTGVPPVIPETPAVRPWSPIVGEQHARRNLPHIQNPGRSYFVTFRLRAKDELTSAARDITLQACVYWHQKKMTLHAACVMPDHVHLLLTPYVDAAGGQIPLGELLHSIKSFSSHEVNKALDRQGSLWLDENWDRIMRDEREFKETWEYIEANPEKCGLGAAYAWFWKSDQGFEDGGEIRTEHRHRRDAGATDISSARDENPRTHVCVFIKHTNACGVGIAADPLEAYRRAYLGDPNAAMGGILACDFVINTEFAAAVMETYDRLGKPLKEAGSPIAPGGFFVEVWVATAFDDEAVDVIRTRKTWGERVRLLAVGEMAAPPDPNEPQYRSIAGGMLVQTPDMLGLNEDQWKVVSKRAPSESELADLRLAWLIAKHTKSNAISICKDGMLLGNGAGQMSRVMSCRIATWLARENGHADKLAGSAAASDAFFPFRDGPDFLIDAGVTAIIQPGGSKRDEDTIKACDERGVAMIFTGTRHFRH